MNVFLGKFWHNVQVLSWFIYGNMIIVKQTNRWMILNDHYWPTWAPAWEEEGGNTWQEGRKRQSKRQGSLANNWGLFKLEYHGVPSYHEAFEENNQNRNQRLEKYNNNCCGTNIHMFAKLLGTKNGNNKNTYIQIVQISNISTYLVYITNPTRS